MKVLVVGASTNPSRYSHIASLRLVSFGHDVIPLGIKEGSIGDLKIITQQKDFEDIHTITMYLSPPNQENMMEYLLSLNPKRIIFNPGSENIKFKQLADKQGIETLHACTLVMLSTNQFESMPSEHGEM